MMGVWVVFDYREGPYAISIHDSAAACETEIAEIEQGHYCFWPIGTDLVSAIIDWVYSDRSHEGPSMAHNILESC